ncbi:high-temperature-induced dauer-formation protein-domain-containing protein [Pilobolus umbonatus]|nr:high-temperature-induced dauer-formation protein-domain-containing protein [Pilobolus umbonatus]
MGATDSKLAFRKGVFRLFEERNVPTTADDYWTLFWTLPESIDDVYTLVGSSDIRRVRDTARENLETLIDKVQRKKGILHQMNQLIQSSSLQPIHLLNCCRVLTRIMPYIFESAETDDWEDRFFWTPRLVKKENTVSSMDVELIKCEKDSVDHKSSASFDTLPPRGEELISLTLKSLFLAGFTLPHAMGTENKVNYVIWETGVGSSTPIGSSRDNDMNRSEVLRLLIVLFSKSMYISPTHILSKKDKWIHHMVAKIEKKTVLAFLCSMLNTACKYNPMGWTVVPYNHIVFTDPKELLVALCLRALLIVVDYRSFDTKESMENAYRHYLSKLHRPQDFQFLIDGIYRILSNPMQTLNTYLPGSSKRVRCHIEMLMLCWKLLELNGRFRNYLMDTERALDLMVVLLYYASENKLDPCKLGLVRMCSFMLQTLSSDRKFSVKLNKPFEGHASLPNNIRIPNFQGSYADYLILTIFSLIASSKGTLSTLYPSMMITITNISCYLKNLSPVTSNKLLSLLSSVSSPGFLLADESNHNLVKYLLEALNNILQFQFSSNPHLIYAVIRNHQKIQKLADFNLDNATTELDRQYQAKESNRPSVDEQSAILPIEMDGERMSEKAKGKLPEGSISRTSSVSSGVSNVQTPTIASTLLPGTRSGFVPTEEWVHQWHSKLPLETMTVLIHTLLPKIEAISPYKSPLSANNEQVIDFLLSLDSAEMLPPAYPVTIRKFEWGEALVVWFKSMLWGHAYVTSLSHYGPWNNTQIKLFQIKHQQPESSTSTPHSTSPRPSFSRSRHSSN